MIRATIAASLTYVLFASSAFAAGESTGPVHSLQVYQSALIVRVGNPPNHSNKPACSVVGEDWVIDLTTDSGKAMYAMLLSAQAQNKDVTVSGEGLCNGALSDREAAISVYVE